jgi:hypothetical protein
VTLFATATLVIMVTEQAENSHAKQRFPSLKKKICSHQKYLRTKGCEDTFDFVNRISGVISLKHIAQKPCPEQDCKAKAVIFKRK